MVKEVSGSLEPFLRYNSLNPLMIPFLKPFGGNCQDAAMLVELRAVRVRLAGAFEGTTIEKFNGLKRYFFRKLIHVFICCFP